jgi:hypothetical protein
MGVQYVVVPEGLAPSSFTTDVIPVPAELSSTLAAQLDLAPVDVPAGLTVFRNEAFVPSRAGVPAGATLPTDGGIAAALSLDLSGFPAALPNDDGHLRWSGPVERGTSVFLSAASSDRWVLQVDGDTVERTKPFGWANAFTVPADGDAVLRFRTPPIRYAVLAIEALAWLWVLRSLLRRRVEGRAAGVSAMVMTGPPVPVDEEREAP